MEISEGLSATAGRNQIRDDLLQVIKDQKKKICLNNEYDSLAIAAEVGRLFTGAPYNPVDDLNHNKNGYPRIVSPSMFVLRTVDKPITLTEIDISHKLGSFTAYPCGRTLILRPDEHHSYLGITLRMPLKFFGSYYMNIVRLKQGIYMVREHHIKTWYPIRFDDEKDGRND